MGGMWEIKDLGLEREKPALVLTSLLLSLPVVHPQG